MQHICHQTLVIYIGKHNFAQTMPRLLKEGDISKRYYKFDTKKLIFVVDVS